MIVTLYALINSVVLIDEAPNIARSTANTASFLNQFRKEWQQASNPWQKLKALKHGLFDSEPYPLPFQNYESLSTFDLIEDKWRASFGMEPISSAEMDLLHSRAGAGSDDLSYGAGSHMNAIRAERTMTATRQPKP